MKLFVLALLLVNSLFVVRGDDSGPYFDDRDDQPARGDDYVENDSDDRDYMDDIEDEDDDFQFDNPDQQSDEDLDAGVPEEDDFDFKDQVEDDLDKGVRPAVPGEEPTVPSTEEPGSGAEPIEDNKGALARHLGLKPEDKPDDFYTK